MIAASVHPHVIAVLRTYTSGLGIDLEVAPFTPAGTVDWDDVRVAEAGAVVVASPNVFGLLEDTSGAARRNRTTKRPRIARIGADAAAAGRAVT